MGIEAELAVGYTRWDFRESFQLLDRQVTFAGPRTDDGIKIKDVRVIQGILRPRRKLKCPADLPQRVFFSPKASIDQTQNAENRAVTRLRANHFLLLRARGAKSELRSGGISFHPIHPTVRISSAKLRHTYAFCPSCLKSILT